MKYEKHIKLSDSITGEIFDSPRTIFFRREGIDECIPELSDNTDYVQMMEAVEAGTSTIEEVDDTLVLTYADNRRAAYPVIGDQLDMLWHAIDGDTALKTTYADFHTAIKAVKDANPKG